MKRFLIVLLCIVISLPMTACLPQEDDKWFRSSATIDVSRQPTEEADPTAEATAAPTEPVHENPEPIEGYPYTVGILSDIHIQTGAVDSSQSQTDFARALEYYENKAVSMVVAAGDLTDNGINEEFARYTAIRDESNLPFYEVTGNHEAATVRTYKSNIGDSNCIAYQLYDLIGKDFCYYLKGDQYVGWRLRLVDGVPQGEKVAYSSGVVIPQGDVYIFMSILGDANNGLFFDGQLRWLQEVLEENRNNRCFVIEHCRAERLKYDSTQEKYVEDLYAGYVSGNFFGKYLKALWGQASNMSNSKRARCFERLMSHYTNCVWLHGHTHMSAKLGAENGAEPALYDKYFGNAYDPDYLKFSADNTEYSYSIHVPSCAEPREETGANAGGSEGCLMLVSQNSITIRYIDFSTDTVLTEYTLPTGRDTIPAGTFYDETGIVK